MDKPDLLIIGLDRLGLDLAMAASALGASVVISMQGETALAFAMRDGEVVSRLSASIFAGAPGFHQHCEALAKWISLTRSPERLRAARVMVEPGEARFIDPKRVAIGARILSPRRIVIATGQIADDPSGLLAEHGLSSLPKRLLISGDGPAALALASVALRAGAKVSLFPGSNASRGFDPEMLALCIEGLEQRGLCLLPELPTLRPAEVPIWPTPSFRPKLAGLDLDHAGVKIHDGQLVLGRHLETSQSRISAIGSVTGKAPHSGMVGYLLARLMFRKAGQFRPPLVIRVIHAAPDLAEIGLTEAEARARWGRISVYRANSSEVGPVTGALGVCKLICDPKGRLAGASILAPDAVALAAPLTLAMEHNLGLQAISAMALPPGASGEALRLAAGAPQRAQPRSPRLQKALRFMRCFG